MTQHGIPKAPYRAFELLHKLNGDMYNNIYRGKTVDIYALQLMAVNHNSLLHDIETEDIEISINDINAVAADIQRVDRENSDACAKWLDDGSPKYMTEGEINILKGISEIKRNFDIASDGNCSLVKFSLPPMGMALINIYLD